MCDYSLEHVKSRPAKVGDKLTTRNFLLGTRGFSASEDASVAVCVLPGTELSFHRRSYARAAVAVAKECAYPSQDRDLPANQPAQPHDPSRCAGIPRRPDRPADLVGRRSARDSSSVACCCCRDESAPACGLRLTARLAGLGRAGVMQTSRAATSLPVVPPKPLEPIRR